MPRRAGSSADWKAIRELCCDTGDGGEPIEDDRQAFGEFWIGPYQRLFPDFGHILEEGGRVVGYLVGCPNTQDLKRLAAAEPLIGRMSAAEKRYPPEAIARLADYPAHLHINLAAPCRGRRLGDLLIGRFKAQVGGIHLFCRAGPLPFYLRIGFRELARTIDEPARFLLVMEP